MFTSWPKAAAHRLCTQCVTCVHSVWCVYTVCDVCTQCVTCVHSVWCVYQCDVCTQSMTCVHRVWHVYTEWCVYTLVGYKLYIYTLLHVTFFPTILYVSIRCKRCWLGTIGWPSGSPQIVQLSQVQVFKMSFYPGQLAKVCWSWNTCLDAEVL